MFKIYKYKIFTAIAKELYQYLRHDFKHFFKFNLNNTDKTVLKNLATIGVSEGRNFYNDVECKNLCRRIDEIIDGNQANIWRDSIGSDERIYFAEEIDPIFNRILESSYVRDMYRLYMGNENPIGMVLAARLTAKDQNLGSGGGWHRDSPYRNQFKAFCYLSKVKPENGPFQFVPSSHRKLLILKALIYGLFKPNVYRFNDEQIKNFQDVFNAKRVCVTSDNPGTLFFADTKILHRGSPIQDGARYALFVYLWDREIPVAFDRHRQISKGSHCER